MWLKALYLVTVHVLSCIHGHARLWEPPARSSMWRRGFKTPINTNDNELNCGGYENQWIKLQGRCGVCGDPYQQMPRENEGGGKYATGIISRFYKAGDVINLTVDLTANHLGYFEFRLCPASEDINVPVTQSCLDNHPVLVIGSRDGRYHVKPHENGIINLKGKLPTTLSCSRCVLQWRYRTGNRWNCDRKSNKCGKGLGTQEEFYGCADVSILDLRFALSSQTKREKVQPAARSMTSLDNSVKRQKISKTPKTFTHEKVQTFEKPSSIKRQWKHRNNKPRKFRPSPTKLWNAGASASRGSRKSFSHLARNVTSNSRKKQLLKTLEGLLWTLMKSLTSSGPNNDKIGLVNWDPISQSYGSDLIYLDNVKNNTQDIVKEEARGSIRADWPIKNPRVVELQHDGGTKTMLLSEYSLADKLPQHKSADKHISSSSPVCVGRKNVHVISGINEWCRVNCKAGNCPSDLCVCHKPASRVRKISHRKLQKSSNYSKNKPKSNSPVRKKLTLNCRGTGLYSRDNKMVIWCTNNCNKGFCPKSMCYCRR